MNSLLMGLPGKSLRGQISNTFALCIAHEKLHMKPVFYKPGMGRCILAAIGPCPFVETSIGFASYFRFPPIYLDGLFFTF